LKQEGRGIGLLSKIRAYNLQDLGHDTVTANLMLGHQADERGYEIAIAILRDLGLGSELGEGVRLLTNNPDKVQALEKEGLRVVERVPMVPRSWRHRSQLQADGGEAQLGKSAGVTMIGGEAARGEDLDKYLRTKILRMGHMLPLYLAGEQAAS
jgi:GTP cyclohydrolase II